MSPPPEWSAPSDQLSGRLATTGSEDDGDDLLLGSGKIRVAGGKRSTAPGLPAMAGS